MLQQTFNRDGSAAIHRYQYDTLGHLTADDRDGIGALFQYDLVGNRLLKQDIQGGGETQYEYKPNSNRITSVAGVSQTLDASGNLINDGANSFTYDGSNRMVSAVSPTASAEYFYNFMGQRVHKRVTSAINTVINTDIHFVYGLSGELLGEYDNNGNRIREYIYRGLEPIAQIDAIGTIRYIHTDHLSTPRLATNSNNVVV